MAVVRNAKFEVCAGNRGGVLKEREAKTQPSNKTGLSLARAHFCKLSLRGRRARSSYVIVLCDCRIDLVCLDAEFFESPLCLPQLELSVTG